ncbi:MAG: preprotein translocase subunit SecA, partial [Candidatus Woesebacteria bacterium]|nr:preprotein translocase subunit SecA [Candidatus Woesebacteria bacterium]
MLGFLNKFFDLNKKEVDLLQAKISPVADFEKKFKKLKDEDFGAKTAELKSRLENGETQDQLLAEAFALVREASDRAIGLRPYDVQLMAAAAFDAGKVAEQKTGEGKTLSAVPALYLNALSGRGVHLVTVNDYLARRDAGWNGPTFHLLGLTVGVIVHEQSFTYDPEYSDTSHGDDRLAHLKPITRREAYACDITYGTNNEFGFDYLRDNMVGSLADKSQREHHFAIVDEVDSILIDEARTPLIISQPDTEPTSKYYEFAKLVDRLSPDTDYVIEEKHRTASLSEAGLSKVEGLLGITNLYEKDFEMIHHLENALKARTLFLLDKHYIVKDDQVIIVDEFTGRLLPGRRWSEGIHQAVEAK